MSTGDDIEKKAAEALADLVQPGPILGHRPSAETDASAGGDELLKVTTKRVTLGLWTGSLTTAAFAAWITLSLVLLGKGPMPTTPLEERLYYARLAVHAALTLGGFYFLYQLLRAAERLLLPAGIVAKKPQAAAVLLGIKSPVEQMDATTLKSLMELVARVADVVRPPK